MEEPKLDDNLETWNRVFEEVGWKRMMDLTEKMDEHPEGYDGPCMCRLCQSYGE